MLDLLGSTLGRYDATLQRPGAVDPALRSKHAQVLRDHTLAQEQLHALVAMVEQLCDVLVSCCLPPYVPVVRLPYPW